MVPDFSRRWVELCKFLVWSFTCVEQQIARSLQVRYARKVWFHVRLRTLSMVRHLALPNLNESINRIR